MGVNKTILAEGNGPSPQKGDRVTMEYTGWLRTAGQPEEKGKQFDSTTGRGPFQTPIGVGRVIKGELVPAILFMGIANDDRQAGTRVSCR